MSHSIPTVAVLILKDDQVLLVRHESQSEHKTGVYGLPGGKIQYNEREIAAAIRELKEETGLEATQEDLIGFPNNTYSAEIKRKDGSIHTFTMKIFICKDFSGMLRTSSETKPEWVILSKLDKYNLLPNVKRAITDSLKFV